MSDTFTQSNALTQPGIGQDSGTWGNLLNTDLSLIDTAIDGVESIALTTTSITLPIANGTASTGRFKLIIFTGTPSGTVSVSITPTNIQKIYKIVNQSSQSVSISNGSGSAALVLSNQSEDVYADGNGNVFGYNSSGTFNSLNLSGNASIGGNLSVAGTSAFTGAETFNGLATFNAGVMIASQTLQNYIFSNTGFSFAAVSITGGQALIIFNQNAPAGSRLAFVLGSVTIANGATVSLPSPFVAGQCTFTPSLNQINTLNPSQPLCHITCSMSGATLTMTADDQNGHSFSGTANIVFFGYTLIY